MLNNLKRPARIAVVLSALWSASIIGIVLYERFVTIGNTDGPWAFYGDYETLIFHQVNIHGEKFAYWLKSQKFYTTLFLPLIALWLVPAFLLPSFRWILAGPKPNKSAE